MEVVLAADENFTPGLAGTVLSLAAARKETQPLTLHVLDGGISDASWGCLEKDLAARRRDVALDRLVLSEQHLSSLPIDFSGIGAMTYARLLVPSLFAVDEILYLDSDLIIFCDLRELWETALGDCLVAACRDTVIVQDATLAFDAPFALTEEEARKPYFNMGVIKMNLAAWRSEHIAEKTLQILREHGRTCRFGDQTALNYVLQDRVKPLAPKWNRFQLSEASFNVAEFEGNQIVVHYLAKQKPWMAQWHRSVSYAIWHLTFLAFAPSLARRAGWKQRMRWRVYVPVVRLINAVGGSAIALTRRLFPRWRAEWAGRQQAKLEILRWFCAHLR